MTIWFPSYIANMSLNVNILLLILSYQCFTISAYKFHGSIRQRDKSSKSDLIIIYELVNNIYSY